MMHQTAALLGLLLICCSSPAVTSQSVPTALPSRQSYNCNGRGECGTIFKPSSLLAPAGQCTACTTGTCTCPSPSCINVVSRCRQDDGKISYKVAFNQCKSKGSGSTKETNIEWVAFSGTNAAGSAFMSHSWLRVDGTTNRFPNTTLCSNTENGSKSTCCLQKNVNGGGQTNLFTVECGITPVFWMKDRTFKSCYSLPNVAPSYVVSNNPAPNSCKGPTNFITEVCGPYTLPNFDCAAIPTCKACSNKEVCRQARNPCELDQFWMSSCTCPENPTKRGGVCMMKQTSSGMKCQCPPGYNANRPTGTTKPTTPPTGTVGVTPL